MSWKEEMSLELRYGACSNTEWVVKLLGTMGHLVRSKGKKKHSGLSWSGTRMTYQEDRGGGAATQEMEALDAQGRNGQQLLKLSSS